MSAASDNTDRLMKDLSLNLSHFQEDIEPFFSYVPKKLRQLVSERYPGHRLVEMNNKVYSDIVDKYDDIDMMDSVVPVTVSGIPEGVPKITLEDDRLVPPQRHAWKDPENKEWGEIYPPEILDMFYEMGYIVPMTLMERKMLKAGDKIAEEELERLREQAI